VNSLAAQHSQRRDSTGWAILRLRSSPIAAIAGAKEANVTAVEPGITDTATDHKLHLVIDAVEANPPAPGRAVDVTLYLPSGASISGSIEPCWYYDQKVLHYLQTVGIDRRRPESNGNGGDSQNSDGTCRTHDYVHLSHAAYRQVNGELDKHDELRVRLADITAWTFGRAEHKGA
jgi:hypothetical protein